LSAISIVSQRMTFDALLANLHQTSANWWKVNKHKNLIKFSCHLLSLLSCVLFFWIN